jgi:hypothetical protein
VGPQETFDARELGRIHGACNCHSVAGGGSVRLSDLLLALRLFVVTGKAWHRRLSLVLRPADWGGQALIAVGAMIYWLNRPG